MEYICADRGSARCPCILMEAGQCYTCSMIQKGKCDCSSLWQGVCPYTEYLQRNKRAVPETQVKRFKLCRTKSFSPTLSVLTLETPLGFGLKCKEMGAFLMVEWKRWFIPISVLRVTEDFKRQLSYVELAVNATGPKTIGLLKKSIIGQDITIKGPFYSGLLNKNRFKRDAMNIVVAKGVALMPLINIKEKISSKSACFKVDDKKLSQEFLEEYLGDIQYEKVDLESGMFEVSEDIKEAFGYCYAGNQRPNLFIMTSPHYVESLLKMTGFNRENVITPNHSNMCCGEGYCGSCSDTDKEGVVVRRCKCIDI